MKKILGLFLALLLLLTMSACGEDVSTDYNESPNVSQGEELSNDSEDKDADEDYSWKEFIDEYDAWVDDYIDLLEKYEKNPTDMSILSDYTDMMIELTEWSDKADDVTVELENSPEEAAKYASELAKIAAKLAKAAQ